MKLKNKIIIFSSVLIFIIFISMFFIPYKHFPKTIIIEKGSSGAEIVNILHKNKVIRSKLHSYIMLYIHRLANKTLKSGEYEFSARESTISAFRKLRKGKVKIHLLTVPEGLTNREVKNIVENESKLLGTITKVYEEGELLPETYDFVYGTTKDEFLARMYKKHIELLNDLWASRDQDLALKNPVELRILASIVEKETGINDERGKIASVFVNRLKVGMPLQADPTVIYALTMGNSDLGRSLTSEDLKLNSPYNTYIVKGLPPTAICNPGKASLIAAAHPEKTNYFYFVSNNNGGHNFATNLADHIVNVNNYRKSQKQSVNPTK